MARRATVVLAALLAACAPEPPEKPRAAKPQVRVDVPRKEIPLDDVKDGRASLERNFYFILDGSGSMLDPPGENCSGDQRFTSKADGAKWAVRQFLDRVPADANLGLWIFDESGSREVVPLGPGNREQFARAVRDMDAGGNTPLAASIRAATDHLVAQYKRQLGYGEYRLVVVTDGIADEIPSAAKHATSYGMPIYTIGLCIGGDHPLRQYSVSYKAADSMDELATALRETLAEAPSFDATAFAKETAGPARNP